MTAAESSNHENILDRAVSALNSGDYHLAISLLTEVIQAYPNAVQPRLGRILSLWHIGYKCEAVTEAAQLRDLFPGDASVTKTFQSLIEFWENGQPGFATAGDIVKNPGSRGYSIPVPWVLTTSIASRLEAPSVHVLPQVAVRGSEGLLLVNGTTKLRESTVDTNLETAWMPVMRRGSNIPDIEKKEGDWAALHGVWSDNFFHWMLEWLPKVLILEHVGFTGKYMVRDSGRFVLEGMDLLGIDRSRIEVHKGQDWTPDRLWIAPCIPACSMTSHYPHFLKLRERLLDACASKQPSSRRRIYLSRKRLDRPRRVVNEEALSAALDTFGFESLCFDDMPLASQIGIFSNVEAVVSPHGAALIHTLFSPRETLILEIFPQAYVNPNAIWISELLDHRYYLIPSYTNGNFDIHRGNIEAFIPMITGTLRREFLRR